MPKFLRPLALGSVRAEALGDGGAIAVNPRRRFRHLYVLGRTGAGKSSLLQRCILQDALGGYGVILVDPGDLAKDVLATLPPKLLPRVAYFSIDRPIPYNPLMRRADEPERVENELISLVNQVSVEAGAAQPLTARMTRLFSYTLRRVMREYPQATLSSVVTCLLEHRDELMAQVDIEKEAFEDTRQGLVDRLARFVKDRRIRRIVCNGHALDFGAFIDEGRILLVRLDGLEPMLQRFVGTLLFNGLQNTILERAEEDRRPCALYVDEFHNFLGSQQAVENFQKLFNQGRRHLLGLTVAHTDFGFMAERMLATMHDNAGTVVSFACGPDPARKMAQIFGGQWPAEAIQFLPDYEAVVRTGDHRGDVVRPMRTYPAPHAARRLVRDDDPLPADPPDPFDLFEQRHQHHARRDPYTMARKPKERAPETSRTS